MKQTAYSTALAPLQYLKNLHLGIFLSDEQLFTSHIDHIEDNESIFLLGGCDLCDEEDDEALVLANEEEAAVALAEKLGSLDTVAWSSFFPTFTPSEQVAESEACTCSGIHGGNDEQEGFGEGDIAFKSVWWIERTNGKITAKNRV